ncbi:MAG TPA: glycosyltransferase [Kaistia sp.]|jgi:hypothetical protein|nr:glycosyltransferase [Kaistia sp.]
MTPLALDADSRTLKSASSYARAGFRSVVVEGRSSGRGAAYPGIEVITLEDRQVPPAPGAAARGRGPVSRIISAIRYGKFGVVAELPLLAAFLVRFVLKFWIAPWRAAPDADLYHIHSFEMFEPVRALARRNGAKVIYDAHDYYQGIDPESGLPQFDRRWLRPLMRRIEARAVRLADAVVTATDGTAALMLGQFGKLPLVLRNCHDSRLDREPAVGLRSRLALGPDDRLLVVVGNYKRGMAIGAVLDALARLPSYVKLAFVGRGYDALDPFLDGCPVADRVYRNLVTDPTELVPFIRSANVGLVVYEPYSENYRHALPNGFFQIVAAGLPMVYPALPQILGAVGDRQLGRCLERLSGESLAVVLAEIMAHPSSGSHATPPMDDLAWYREEVILMRLAESLLQCDRSSEDIRKEQVVTKKNLKEEAVSTSQKGDD